MSFAQPPKRRHTSRRRVTRAQYQAIRHAKRLIDRYVHGILNKREDPIAPGHITAEELPHLTASDLAILEEAFFAPPNDQSYRKCNTCLYTFKTHASGVLDLHDVAVHKKSHAVQPQGREFQGADETIGLPHQVAFTRRDSTFTTPGLGYALSAFARNGGQGGARRC